MQVDPTSPTRLPAPEPVESTGHAAPRTRRARRERRGTPAILLLALVAAGLIVSSAAWLLVRGDGGGTAQPQQKTARPVGVSMSQLNALATGVGHPIYWAGSEAGTTYELTRTTDGRIYVRYLPSEAKIGNASPQYLTVGTYPQHNAFSTLQATAKKQGAPTIQLPGGGLAFEDTAHPTSFYVAYPGSDYQIEVYDPSPTLVAKLLTAGDITPVPAASTARAGSTRVSVRQLKALAVKLGHPLFWAGTEPGKTYELTQTTSGGVYVRYLPHGTAVGTSRPEFITVGTYPQQGAFASLKAQKATTHVDSFGVTGGGLAVVDKAHPTSVYIAYPGLDFVIEVYAPTAARARELASSGRITRIG